ncbi:MAG: LLM class flavin-dependent oxidoreductase [Candidatus Bathyarchaeia archaeon]
MNNETSYGYLLPTRGLVQKGGKPDFRTILDLAELAEKSGFNSLWVGDSILAKPRLDPFTTLAAVAAVCPKSTLGMSVLLPALRHPVVLAHAIATLDLIAAGKLLIGVGVGGPMEIYRREFEGCGIPFKQRISRTDETVKVMKMLWSKERVNFIGKTCSLQDVTLDPKPYTEGGPKILMSSGMVSTAFERTARFTDGWMSAEVFPNEFKEGLSKVQSFAPKKEMISSLYMTMNLNDDSSKAKSETVDYLTKYYGAAPPLDRWGPFGSPKDAVKIINAFHDAGARVFAIRFSSHNQEKQIKWFADEVLPHLKH